MFPAYKLLLLIFVVILIDPSNINDLNSSIAAFNVASFRIFLFK